MKFLEIKLGTETCLPSHADSPERVHVFDQPSIDAVNAALAAKRPLLLKGEPGIGKSQMARAVAKELKCAFVQYVVDSQTESRDLLWRFDAVQRLADAQLSSALKETPDGVRKKLAVSNYIHPGVLWWAFNWEEALAQVEIVKGQAPMTTTANHPNNGCVVLIDEIDKAEMDIPNGLLEALGDEQFTPQGWNEPVCANRTPLVMITTNNERALPNAFLRRCLVLHLSLPKEQTAMQDTLVARGKAHFKNLHEDVLFEAAKILYRERMESQKAMLQPLPGQAEYLDLLRAVHNLAPNDTQKQFKELKKIACYVVSKQPDSEK